MTTTVGHWKLDRCEIYVGRGSIWGNPFATAAVAARSKYECIVSTDPIRDYELHLRASPELMRALPSLRGRSLGCFCRRLADPISMPSMERCHGEVLARYADRGVTMCPSGPR